MTHNSDTEIADISFFEQQCLRYLSFGTIVYILWSYVYSMQTLLHLHLYIFRHTEPQELK